MIQHLTTGGVYLVGGLTKSLIQKINQSDILKEWKLRHPEMINLIESMPIVFCN
jgi:glucokinase